MGKMQPQTKAFLDKLIEDPKIDQTQAYLDTHIVRATPSNPQRKMAGDNASRLMARSSSRVYMKKHIKMAKETAVEVLENARRYKNKIAFQRLAADQAERIMDRELGRPIARVEQQNTNINLNVEGSKELSDQFTEFLKQQSQME